tara:strand:- start:1229 stop:2395 length:1167 start_codon:yes stop_codon:yes gene_type:complete
MLLPIIAMPLLSQTLGVEGLGRILLINTVLQFGIVCSSYSFNYVGTRDIALTKTRKESSLIYWEVQLTKLLLLVIYSLVISLIFDCLGKVAFHILFSFLIFGLLGHWFIAIWYYQGKSKLKLPSFVMLLARVSTLLCIIMVVNDSSDYYIALYSNVLPVFFFGFFFFLFEIKSYKLSFRKIICCSKKIKKNIIKGGDVFIGDFAPNLYNNIPSLIVGVSSNPILYASYAVATRITNAFVTFQSTLARAIYPYLVKSEDDNVKFICLLNLATSVPVILILNLFSDSIIFILMGESSDVGSYFLKISSIGIIFVGLANSFGQGYFLPKGKNIVFRNVSLFVSFTSSLVGIFLILYYNAFGAIMLMLFARALFSITYFLAYINDKRKSLSV